MITGAFSPSGARSEGHDAIAEASEAQEARMARFSIGYVVVACGRRPHGCLHS